MLGTSESDVDEAVLIGLFSRKTVAKNRENRRVGMFGEELIAIGL